MTNDKPFRPLLAASIDQDEDLLKLEYPLIASPKVDGIRVLCHPVYGPCTRSLKPVPNEFIRFILRTPNVIGFDGEIVVGPLSAANVFNQTTSAVMTHDGEPEFTYWVFDDFTEYKPYSERHATMLKRIHEMKTWYKPILDPIPWIEALPAIKVKNAEEVIGYELSCLAAGFEGIMLRHKSGPYKWGRSTLRQQTLMKLKRFVDAEAEIIGFEALYRNTNPQTRNPLGLNERSSHKAGKIEAETLGNLLVRDLSGRFGDFSIGSGFDATLRLSIWNSRAEYLGRRVSYKFQACGVVEAPRFPIFKGFRPQE